MKFSEIRKDQWADLSPYLDTCLLPLTGLTGDEPPWKTAELLGKLQDVMDRLEIPYKGRIVTYPALHFFSPPGHYTDYVNHICRKLKEGGFAHVFLATADPGIAVMPFEAADLLVTAETGDELSSKVRDVWNNPPAGAAE
jgi:23S rRNA (pseudouridine1915-N3)-methyltransferase